jgi:hypothetical protein
MRPVWIKIKSGAAAAVSGGGVSRARQSLQSARPAWRIALPNRGVAPMLPLLSMDKYDNPYRDDPESVPLTRVGRLAECALALLLALLAVYLSR